MEPNGTPLQYIHAPYVVALYHPESWRNPRLRWISTRARKRFDQLPLPADWMKTASGPGYRVSRISCVHPEAQLLGRTHPGFRFQVRSVFDRMPGACHVIRTMNILNASYFSQEQLREGVRTVFDSLKPGGMWIVGRTLRRISATTCFLPAPGEKLGSAGACRQGLGTGTAGIGDSEMKALNGRVRVLLISDSYPPVLGGSEIEAQRVSAAMIRRGHRVQVLCAGGPPMPEVRDWVDPWGRRSVS